MSQDAREWGCADLTALTCRQETYSFSWRGPAETASLRESVARFGLLRPLLAFAEGEGLVVVAGARRLALLRELGGVRAPVRRVDGLGPEALWDLLLEDQVSAGALNPVELGLYAAKRGRATGEPPEVLASRVLPRLGLPPRVGVLADPLWVAGLPDRHRGAFASGVFPVQGVRMLARIPREQALAVLDALEGARVGVNKFSEVAKGLLECSWRDDVEPGQWLEREGLTGLTGEELRGELRRRRFPRLSEWETGFRSAVGQAALPASVRLAHAPGFEGGKLTCTLSFGSLRELAGLSELVGAAVAEGRLDGLDEYLG